MTHVRNKRVDSYCSESSLACRRDRLRMRGTSQYAFRSGMTLPLFLQRAAYYRTTQCVRLVRIWPADTLFSALVKGFEWKVAFTWQRDRKWHLRVRNSSLLPSFNKVCCSVISRCETYRSPSSWWASGRFYGLRFFQPSSWLMKWTGKSWTVSPEQKWRWGKKSFLKSVQPDGEKCFFFETTEMRVLY